MPDKRAKNKAQVKAWIDAETKQEVQRILHKRGLTLTDEILKLFNEILKKELDNEKNKRNNKTSK